MRKINFIELRRKTICLLPGILIFIFLFISEETPLFTRIAVATYGAFLLQTMGFILYHISIITIKYFLGDEKYDQNLPGWTNEKSIAAVLLLSILWIYLQYSKQENISTIKACANDYSYEYESGDFTEISQIIEFCQKEISENDDYFYE